jgi:hypothetical protein
MSTMLLKIRSSCAVLALAIGATCFEDSPRAMAEPVCTDVFITIYRARNMATGRPQGLIINFKPYVTGARARIKQTEISYKMAGRSQDLDASSRSYVVVRYGDYQSIEIRYIAVRFADGGIAVCPDVSVPEILNLNSLPVLETGDPRGANYW